MLLSLSLVSWHFSTYRWPMQVPDLNSLIFLQQKWRWQKPTLKSANASSPNLCSKRKLDIFCEWCISFYNFFYLQFLIECHNLIFQWNDSLCGAYAGYFQWFSFLKPCPFLHLTISWHSGLLPNQQSIHRSPCPTVFSPNHCVPQYERSVATSLLVCYIFKLVKNIHY